MAESGFSSGSESGDELDLEVLSGYVQTVYKSYKEKVSAAGKRAASRSASETVDMRDVLFHKVVSCAAKTLNLDCAPYQTVKPSLTPLPSIDRLLLPLDEAMVKQCQTIWERPASATPVHKTMDRKYRAPRESVIHCFSHPYADSAVVKFASGGRTSSAVEFPLTDSESKVMDSIGKRAYHSGGLSLRQANLALVLARYNKHLWTLLSDELENLPEDLKNKALELQKEGLAAADVSIEIAKDQADVAARVMACGIILRRRAWLRITNLTYPFQTMLIDQPFEGVTLFSPATGELIKNRHKSPAGAKQATVPKSNGTTPAKSPGVATAAKSPGVATAAKSPGVATATKSPGVATAAKSKGAATAAKSKGAATAAKSKGAATAAKSPGAATAAKSPGASAPKRKRRRKNPAQQE